MRALVKPTTEVGEEAYGRAIFNEVQTGLNREVAAGAVYATLDRLEQKGLISSRVGEGNEARGGNPRRYYAIEGAGIKALNEAKAATERLWDGVRWPVKGIA